MGPIAAMLMCIAFVGIAAHLADLRNYFAAFLFLLLALACGRMVFEYPGANPLIVTTEAMR